ncbi:reverse transcriptase domain, reverse transcriptase zinc-binding domain protein [Tanacetum coccineum]
MLTGKWTPMNREIVSKAYLQDQDEYIVWKDLHGNEHPFSVHVVWDVIRPRGIEVDWDPIVWFPNCIPRHAFLVWLIMRKKLKTQDTLKQWDVGAYTNLNLLESTAAMDGIGPVWDDIVSWLLRMSSKRSIVSVVARLVLDMGLLDFIKTVDPQKVRAVEVQKGDDQVTLLESTRHCFMPLVIPAVGGSGSVAATEIPTPTERGQKSFAEEDAYMELANPGEGTAMVRQSDEEVVTEKPKKIKKKRLTKQSDVLPAKRLRTDHASLSSGTGGKTLAGLEQIMPAGSRLLAREHSSTLSAPVDTAATTTTSTKAKLAANVNPDLAGPSQLEESEGSDDSFYEIATLDPFEAKRWYVPRWNITNDSLLDDGFSCRTLVDRVAPPPSSLLSVPWTVINYIRSLM